MIKQIHKLASNSTKQLTVFFSHSFSKASIKESPFNLLYVHPTYKQGKYSKKSSSLLFFTPSVLSFVFNQLNQWNTQTAAMFGTILASSFIAKIWVDKGKKYRIHCLQDDNKNLFIALPKIPTTMMMQLNNGLLLSDYKDIIQTYHPLLEGKPELKQMDNLMQYLKQSNKKQYRKFRLLDYGLIWLKVQYSDIKLTMVLRQMNEEQKMRVKEYAKNGSTVEILEFVKDIYLKIPQRFVVKVEQENVSQLKDQQKKKMLRSVNQNRKTLYLTTKLNSQNFFDQESKEKFVSQISQENCQILFNDRTNLSLEKNAKNAKNEAK